MTPTAACDEIVLRLLRGEPRDAACDAHVATCAACRAAVPRAAALARTLAADPPSAPSPALAARVHAAALPLLAGHARRVAWGALGRALGAGLLPLPLILVVAAWGLRTLYGLLSVVLPPTLSLVLVLDYAALLALALALTYGAIPFLVARQYPRAPEVHHV